MTATAPHGKTPRFRVAAVGLALSALLISLSCGREVTGPERGVRQSRALAIQPEFRTASGDASVSSGVAFARVRLTLERPGGAVALDRVVDFPTDRDSVPLSLTVDLSADAPVEGERMSLRLRFITAAGDTVFRSGPDTLLVEPARAGAPPTTVVVLPIYVGPGVQATRVDFLPTSATTQGGNSLTFTAQAFDGQGSAVPDAPIVFRSTDSTLVRFANSRVGTATTFVRRGSATVIASLLTGPADSAVVTTTLPAAAIAATQGNGQSGPAGSTLSTPVVVRVTASDALGVPGVTVSFAAGNGGSVGAASVVSDANGNASTTWTLGPAAGAQSLTATAVGLTGSPVTFSATASSTVATQLVFTAGPTSAQAGASLGAIIVTARDAQNNVATAFTGAVALAFGANPGSGTLAGTLTANAVSGVATFSGISVDRAAGGYTLVASSGALTAATSAAFAVTAAAATTLAFSVQPLSAPVATPLVPAVQVVARDAFNNTATGFTGAVTLAFGANPGGATLGGTLVVNAVAGVATFPGLTVSAIGAGYTLVANATGLPSATSTAFNTSAALIAWINPAGGNWTAASNWSLGRVPNAIDSVVIDLAGTYTVTIDTAFTGTFITVGGASGLQTLALTSRALTIAGQLRTQGTGVFAMNSATLNGAGSLVNTATASLFNSTINTPVVNAGTLTGNATATLTGALTTTATSVLRARSDGTSGFVNFTVATGFTNLGAIELTSPGFGATFAVTAGTLVNAPGATITALVEGGGTRTLSAAVDNQGTMTIAQGTAWGRTGGVHTNSGTLDVSGGNLDLNQSGGGLTNTGTLTIGAGRTFTTSSTAFTNNGGTLAGTGTLGFSGAVVTFTTDFSNASLTLTLTGSTVNGPGILTNAVGRTLALFNTTINAPVVNAGTLIGNATATLTGALTTTATSVLRARSDGTSGFVNFTVATGFTNLGAIELTSPGFGATFAVTAGTLVNAPGATITALVEGGGTRTLSAAVDNQGTMTIAQGTAWGRTGGVHTNSGTLDVSGGNLDLNQSGGGLTNTGTLTIGAGRTFTTSSTAFTNNGGTLAGTGTLGFSGAVVTFTTDFSNASLTLTLTGSTVNGPGILTNAVGRTLALFNTTINAPVVNAGTLTGNATATLTGALTTTATSVLRARSDGTSGFVNFTVATGFTNLGAIELTSPGFGATFAVTAGTLVNAPGATITALVEGGGTRTLSAAVDNQGTMTIAQGTAWGRTGGVHTNSGTLDVSGGNLDLNQSGGGLTNTGTLTIGAGRTFTTSSTAFTNNGGTLAGTGTLGFSGAVVTFTTDFSNASLTLTLTGSTVNGPGILTNAVGRTLALFNTTINAPVVNAGTLTGNATATLTGALTTTATSVLRARSDGTSGFVNFTVATGFTNLGAIELTSPGFGATFAVTAGTLVNAPGATITALVEGGGTRTLSAAVDNQGTMTIAQGTAWGRTGGVHTNSGTLDVSGGNLDLNQSGGGLTNTGTLTIGAGRTFTTSSTAFTNNGGTLAGTGTLGFSGAVVTFTTDFSNASLTLTLTGSTVNGPGILTNAVGRTLALFNTTINAPVVNAGTLTGNATATLTGALTTTATSVLRARSDGTSGFVNFTVATGFTNLGAIELTSPGFGATFAVTAGTLVNAPGATITALVEGGGTRTLSAAVDNQGTMTIAQGTAWGRTGGVHTNSGTLDVSGGNLDLNQSGGGLTNTGTLTIGAGRTFTTSSTAFTNNGGTLAGTGTLGFSGAVVTFTTDFSNASLTLTLTGSTVNGPGILTNAVGRTLALFNTTINAPVVNAGTLTGNATATLTGALTTTATSVLRARSDGTSGFVNFTVATGFTNLGAIELTSPGFGATFAVTAGTLVNAPGATITALVEGGGTRTLSAAVDNQGTLSVSPGSASVFSINGSLTTSGTISLDLGGLAAGTQYDQIVVTGPLSLSGTLNVGLFGAFVPVSTNGFTILTNTGVRTGGFDTTNLAAPLGPNPLYGANSVIVSVP